MADVAMPGEDGLSLIRKVRALGHARGGDVPALALTALATAADGEHILAAGFQAHMAKPVDVEGCCGSGRTSAASWRLAQQWLHSTGGKRGTDWGHPSFLGQRPAPGGDWSHVSPPKAKQRHRGVGGEWSDCFRLLRPVGDARRSCLFDDSVSGLHSEWPAGEAPLCTERVRCCESLGDAALARQRCGRVGGRPGRGAVRLAGPQAGV